MSDTPNIASKIDTAIDVYVAWVDARRVLWEAERVECEARVRFLKVLSDFSDEEGDALLTRISMAYERAGVPFRGCDV